MYVCLVLVDKMKVAGCLKNEGKSWTNVGLEMGLVAVPFLERPVLEATESIGRSSRCFFLCCSESSLTMNGDR